MPVEVPPEVLGGADPPDWLGAEGFDEDELDELVVVVLFVVVVVVVIDVVVAFVFLFFLVAVRALGAISSKFPWTPSEIRKWANEMPALVTSPSS